MISAANVTTSASVVVPANVKRVALLIQNTSDTPVYLKFDDSTTPLTTSNGFMLGVNETLQFSTRETVCFDDVYAIHGSTGTKVIRVQEFNRI